MRFAFAVVLVAASAGEARALPRFAVRTGATCATCHVNPSGGGMRNSYGRNVFGPTRLPLRVADDGGGRLLDTDLTETVALGADARATALYANPEKGPNTFTLFLMQADAYLAASPSEALTFYMDLGFYGSSEAMILLRSGGFHLKAGRFTPSYGLRLENHNVFVRQDIGFGPRQKDTGVEVGFTGGGFHVQASALNGNTRPDALTDDNWQKALALRAEWIRRGSHMNLMLGASGYYNISGTDTAAGDTRAAEIRTGAFAGASLGRFTYLAEADVVQGRKFSEYEWERRYVSYQELDVLLARGLELNLNWEYQDPDLRTSANGFHRGLVGFELFPAPHLELKIFYRRIFGPDENPLTGLHEAFVMLHFYL